MQPQLSFLFPVDTSAADAIAAVAAYYGVVVSIDGDAPIAPPNVQAVIDAASASIQSLPATPTAPSAVSAPAAPQGAAVTAPPAPATQSHGQVDKDGLPWDARIHATPATLTDKGYWRAKRGVGNDKAFVAGVEAELRKIAAIPAPGAVAATAPADILEQPDTVSRSAYAHAKAVEICGPQPVDDETLRRLLAGTQTTLTIEQSNWYVAYSAARNKAYQEYMTWDQVGQQPAVVAPEAPAAPDPVVTAPPAPVVVMPAGQGATAIIVDPSATVAPPAPAAAQTPPAPAASPFVTPEQAGTSFALMMRWIVQNKVGGRLTDANVSESVAAFGFADANGVGVIAQTAQRADFWPHIVQMLQGYGAF